MITKKKYSTSNRHLKIVLEQQLQEPQPELTEYEKASKEFNVLYNYLYNDYDNVKLKIVYNSKIK